MWALSSFLYGHPRANCIHSVWHDPGRTTLTSADVARAIPLQAEGQRLPDLVQGCRTRSSHPAQDPRRAGARTATRMLGDERVREVRRLGPRLDEIERSDLGPVTASERGLRANVVLEHECRSHATVPRSPASAGAPEEKAGQALPDDDTREQDRAQPGRHADLGRAGRDEGQVPRDPGPVRRQDVKGPEQVGQVGEGHDGEVEAPESQEHGREEPEIEPGSPPERSRGPWASSSARLYAGAGAVRAGAIRPVAGVPQAGLSWKSGLGVCADARWVHKREADSRA